MTPATERCNKLDREPSLARLAADDGYEKAKLVRLTFAQCIVFAASIATADADSDNSVTAAQVNGTRKTKGAEFKIWALAKQRLQVEFSGVYEYKTPKGPMANEGEGSGGATIKGDTAIFKPKGRKRNARSH